MNRPPLVLAALALLAAAVPPAAAQGATPPPRPVLLAPQDGRQVPPPLRPVTFKVRARASERPDALRIQFTDADGTVDRTGRFHAEGGVDDFALRQVVPGGRVWAVTVPAETFQRYGDRHLFWQAYRLLPPSQCRRIRATGRLDCFQESARREFELLDPVGWGNMEPNDTPQTATTDFFDSDCAYLETTTDEDWLRHDGVPEPMTLRLALDNTSDSDRWKPLAPPRRESASITATVLEADGLRTIAAINVPVGRREVLRAPLKANTPYLVAFRHGRNGFPTARPAANLSYRFALNFPSESDFAACG